MDRTASRSTIATSIVLATVAACLTMVRWSASSAATPLPTVIQTKVIGYSVLHRPITAYRLGDPTSRTKTVLLGQMHGDEHAGIDVAQAVIHGQPIRGIDLWVVPSMNPDGNAVHTRGNAHGVDLNRNWPDYWAHLTGQYYSGPAPLSEPESRAMYSFLLSVRPGLMVSVHQPLNGVDTTDGGTRNPAFAARLARGIGLPLKAFMCWSVCLGSMTGWITNHQSGAAVTVEFPASPSSSWLTSKTPPAIIWAFGGAYDTVARHNPLLGVGVASARGSTVTIAGWTFDPDSRAGSIGVYMYEGSRRVAHVIANRIGPTVNRIYHLTGRHGFSASFAAANGVHTYCIVAGNIGYGDRNPQICRTITVNGDPLGAFAWATTSRPGSVTVAGWAFDRDATSASSSIQVREGSTVIGTYVANGPSPTVNRTYHVTGSHGFRITFAAAAGQHTYTVYAVNLGSTLATPFVSLGDHTVTVAAAPPPAAPAAPTAPVSPTASASPSGDATK